MLIGVVVAAVFAAVIVAVALLSFASTLGAS
jgi:hypothetical protein